MKTVKDVFSVFKPAISHLYSINEAETITLLVVNIITGLSKAKIKAFPETELSRQQSAKLEGILKQLLTGKPMQYILGETEFYGLTFKVNPSVLIPRPETEELVEWVIGEVNSGRWAVGSERRDVGSILDIGTGSGCIAIALTKNLPGFQVSAMDISANALATAKQNAELNEVEINFIEADILHTITETQFPKFDIVISNPPYVTPHDTTVMHANVVDFEPHIALFVPEDDPLIFYKAIADFALKNMATGGLLFFEINENYGEQVVEMLGFKSFKNMELRKDMSGRDRMVKVAID